VQQFDGMDRNQRLEWLLKNCRETYQATKQCLETNYYGTKQVTEALLPLLQCSPDSRIVNVSSSVGLLRVINSIDHTPYRSIQRFPHSYMYIFFLGKCSNSETRS
jgi:(+)-neomenthol dehydrogenase